MADNILRFIAENGILTFFLGTVIGFAASNVIKSFKTNIIDYYLIKLFNVNTNNSNLIVFSTSLLEFIIIIYLLYLLYTKVFKNIFDKTSTNKQNEQIWKDKILANLIQLNEKTPDQNRTLLNSQRGIVL